MAKGTSPGRHRSPGVGRSKTRGTPRHVQLTRVGVGQIPQYQYKRPPGDLHIAQVYNVMRIGGIESFMIDLSETLRRKGHWSDILIEYPETNTHPVVVHPFPWPGRQIPQAHLLKLNDYDIIHVHYVSTEKAAAEIRQANPPIVETLHGPYRSTLTEEISDQLVAVSPDIQRDIEKDLLVSCEYIPSGIDLRNFPFRPRLGPYVLTFSRPDPTKGYVLFDEAAKILCSRGWEKERLIIGLGWKPDEVLQHSRVILNQPGRALLRDVRVCVVTSPFHRGWPLTLWEAMATGCNIVCTKGTAGEEFATETYKKGDARSLANAIARAYKNETGQVKAREYVQEHRNMDHIADQYISLYKELIDARKQQ